jgi:AraC-like DNA-binding protein
MLRYADSLHVELERVRLQRPEVNLQIFYYQEEVFRSIAYANMKQPQPALAAIRRAEALYRQGWDGTPYGIMIDEMYADYWIAVENYDRALEHIDRAIRFYGDGGYELNLLDKQRTRAFVLSKKGDNKTAAEIYGDVIEKMEESNVKQFFEQINELRTLYKLDRAELEIERRQAEASRQRMIIAGQALGGLAMIIIICLAVWSRRRIAMKNRGLYRQIKEQEQMTGEMERLRRLLDENSAEKQTQPNDTQDTQDTQDTHDTALPVSTPAEEIRHQKLVVRLHEYLLRNRNFANHDNTVINKIVEALNTNRTYLYQAVKETMGKTINEYITSLRLEEAKRMLDSGNETIEVIAEMCGYNSRSAFHHQFRERYNISPAEYRKLKKQGI